MSQEDLSQYMENEYNGFAITTRPELVFNSATGSNETRDSIAGQFQLGEQIKGLESLAVGTLTKKNVDLNQLIVQDVTGGTFIGDPLSVSNPTEIIRGQTTLDTVSSYEVFKYLDAPYKFYLETDTVNQRQSDNGVYIAGATSTADLAYITNRQFIIEQNDIRSRLRVVDPNYIEKFVDTYETVLNG